MEEKKTIVILILQTEIEHFANGAPPLKLHVVIGSDNKYNSWYITVNNKYKGMLFYQWIYFEQNLRCDEITNDTSNKNQVLYEFSLRNFEM